MDNNDYVPKSEWKWFGKPGHFICARWCRFHLCTLIGPVVVSTVGEYVHPRHAQGSEIKEAEWIRLNFPGEDIGLDRKYETMVFRARPCSDPDCSCGGHPIAVDLTELDARGYNDAASATEGHYSMCDKWSFREFLRRVDR